MMVFMRQVCCAMLAVIAISSLAYAATNASAKKPQGEILWKFADCTVTNSGRQGTGPEGIGIVDYTISGMATAQAKGLPFQQGRLVLTITAFSPSKDLPGQKAGRWYLRGQWKITNVQAKPEELRARHSTAIVSGDFTSEHAANPLASHEFAAETRIQMWISGLRNSYGEIAFANGGSPFTGSIRDLKRPAPATAQRGGTPGN